MSSAHDPVPALIRRLNGRRLIWVGIRGQDGEELSRFPELAASFSITTGMRIRPASLQTNVVYEDITGVRPDLDDPELNIDDGEAGDDYRRQLFRAAERDCVIVTYRATDLTSELAFTTSGATVLGLTNQRYAAFDHKPWVDASLTAAGIRGLGWTYWSRERHDEVRRLLAHRPHVLRTARTSGGAGIALIQSDADLDAAWPSNERFVALAPYLDDAVPVNFSGCVFADGSVRLHAPSVQLIGIPSCTSRQFGYCGNDFDRIRELPTRVLEALDRLGRDIGSWLWSEHYLGTFGIDALIHQDHTYFTEINPRFQGSTRLSVELANELDEPNLLMDHLAATLETGPMGPGLSLRTWAQEQAQRSHVVIHNTVDRQLVLRSDPELPTNDVAISQLPVGLKVDPGGVLGQLELRSSVTEAGSSLDDTTSLLVSALRAAYE